MKIAYATYVDHQEEIVYPIDFLSSKIPGLIVYCSDKENQLQKDWRIIDHKITIPLDISIAQNKCVSHVFGTTDVDFVVYLQADIYITNIGHEIISDFCKLVNLNKYLALILTLFKFFHNGGSTHF